MARRAGRGDVWYGYQGQEAIRLGYRVHLLVNAAVTAVGKLARFGDAQQWRQGWLIKKIDLINLEASRRDLDKKFWPPRDPRWNFTTFIAIKAKDKKTMKRALRIILRTLDIPDPTVYVLEPQLPYTPNW